MGDGRYKALTFRSLGNVLVCVALAVFALAWLALARFPVESPSQAIDVALRVAVSAFTSFGAQRAITRAFDCDHRPPLAAGVVALVLLVGAVLSGCGSVGSDPSTREGEGSTCMLIDQMFALEM